MAQESSAITELVVEGVVLHPFVKAPSCSTTLFLGAAGLPFEKLSMITLKKPLTGEQFSGKVAENCIAIWKHKGIDIDAEAPTIQKFLDIFKPQMHPPSSKIFFTFHAFGAVTIAFSEDGTTPESGEVIESKALSEAILESIIGEHGVSPAAKRCLAERVSKLLENF